jgi:hypothetical protein
MYAAMVEAGITEIWIAKKYLITRLLFIDETECNSNQLNNGKERW